AEFLGGVRPNPAGIERIGRAGPLQLLADLPIDPVARQQSRDRLVKGLRVRDPQKVARVRESRWRKGRRGDLLRAQPELAKEALVQPRRPPQRPRRMLVKHDDPVILGRTCRRNREGSGKLTKVEGILDRVELKAFPWQRALRQSPEKGVP